MPEVLFTVRLPDGVERQCYSPSTVVREFFLAGEEMPFAEFLTRSRTAYAQASERVRAKYGFSCSSAQDQLAQIQSWAADYPQGGTVAILRM